MTGRRSPSARERVATTAPWRRHAADRPDLRWERDGSGKWILVGRNPDGNPVVVRTERAPGVRTSRRSAATGPREDREPRCAHERRPADPWSFWDRGRYENGQ